MRLGISLAITQPIPRIAPVVTQLIFHVQPSNVATNTNISPAVVVYVADAMGNPVDSFTGNVTMSIASGPGGATLSGTLVKAAVAGVATFSDLKLDTAGDFTLGASGDAFSVQSASFTVSSGNVTITDDFVRADQINLGTSAEGWSWSPGDLETGGLGRVDIVSFQAKELTAALACCVRAEQSFSTDDNYAEALIVARGTGAGEGVCCRMSNDAVGPTYYMAYLLDASDNVQLYKNTGGSNFVQIGSNAPVTVSLPQVLKVSASGGTIKAYWNGVEVLSVSDSTLTTGKKSGLRTGGAGVTRRIYGNFQAGDL